LLPWSFFFLGLLVLVLLQVVDDMHGAEWTEDVQVLGREVGIPGWRK
jgi:hypothetical protein